MQTISIGLCGMQGSTWKQKRGKRKINVKKGRINRHQVRNKKKHKVRTEEIKDRKKGTNTEKR